MSTDLLQDLLAVTGAVLIVIGVGLVSIPLAIVLAGVGSLTTAWLWARQTKAAPPPSGGK